MRRLVVKSTTAVYGSSPRDPAMFTEDMAAAALPPRGFRQGRRRGRGLRPRLRAAAGPTSTCTMLRFANVIGPGIDTAADRLLRAAGGARPCSASTRGCSSCHEDDAHRGAAPRRRSSDRPGIVQRRRRRRAHCSRRRSAAPAEPTVPVPAPAGLARLGRSSARTAARSTSRPSRCASSRSVAAWTPRRCASELGFEPRVHHAPRRSPTSLRQRDRAASSTPLAVQPAEPRSA